MGYRFDEQHPRYKGKFNWDIIMEDITVVLILLSLIFMVAQVVRWAI